MSLVSNVGNQSTGVQISGDGNTVTVFAGRASLALARPQIRKAEPKTELELLRVDVRATTLVGRAPELAALEAWLADDRPISCRCLVARAGTGKTRLAVELCERVEQAGWTAGFVLKEPFRAFVANAADWRWTTPTLVVVDYAASFARDLRTWLEILAAGHYPAAKRLRVLLLERHADIELGWFADLMRVTSFSAPSPAGLADPSLPVPLESLGKLEDRRALLAETMRHAAAIARSAIQPRPPPPGADAEFDRRLADDTIDNEPLYLMMAGAEAVHTGAPAALRLKRNELAGLAAARETTRLERLAAQAGMNDELFTHLALCVTLQGGCSFEDGLRLLGEEIAALNLVPSLGAEATIDWLAAAMPMSASEEIDAMRPDLVAEAFVLVTMRTHSRYPRKTNGIVERCWRRAPRNVAAFLVRAAQDFAHDDPKHQSVLWLGARIEQTKDLRGLFAAMDAMPFASLALRELALDVTGRVVDVLRARNDDVHSSAGLYFTHSLVSLAMRLSEVGRYEAAVDAARESVDIYRRLVAEQPAVYLPRLALALDVLAGALAGAGQGEAAVRAAREAVGAYRELTRDRPETFMPQLAMALNTLAIGLREVDDAEASLDAVNEAILIRRELVARQPDASRTDLAASLESLAVTLGKLGRHEAALNGAREAVVIRREMVAARPDAFRADLAESLRILAGSLRGVGQREPALAAANEAIAMERELAAQRPDADQTDLAVSLAILAVAFYTSSRPAEAHASSTEAIALLEAPFFARPLTMASLMHFSVGHHLAHCEAAGVNADTARLSPIIDKLNETLGSKP